MHVLLPLAVVAIAGTATIASAESSLSPARLQPTSSSVYFDLVTSDAVGVVEIYDYHGQAVGKLLGSRAVALGGNSGLRVQMNPAPSNDVLAVLAIDGVKIADQVVEFHRQGR
jgi:hypothetical protein